MTRLDPDAVVAAVPEQEVRTLQLIKAVAAGAVMLLLGVVVLSQTTPPRRGRDLRGPHRRHPRDHPGLWANAATTAGLVAHTAATFPTREYLRRVCRDLTRAA